MLGLVLGLLTTLSFAAGIDVPLFEGVYPGKNYNCGHTVDTVMCWGSNEYNQSITIEALSNIKEIKLEEKFGCVLDEVGMTCWGAEAPTLSPEMTENTNISQFEVSTGGVCAIINSKISCVSTGSPALENYPKQLSKVTDLGINRSYGCAVSEGKLHCWGNPSNELSSTPTNLGYVLGVAVSQNTVCINNAANELICWGYQNNSKPFKPDFQMKSIANSNYTKCALGVNGEVHCIGDSQPKFPESFGKVVKLESNVEGTYCAVDEKKRFSCWGFYNAGQVPPVVKSPVMMAAGYKGTYFVNKKNELYGAGRARIVNSKQLKNVTFLSAKYNNLCYIDDNGPACLGGDVYGETSIPNDIEGISAIVPGDETVCAIVPQGKVRCWGNGRFGRANPPKGLSSVTKIVGGEYHFCALTNVNTVHCWGWEITIPNFDKNLKILDISSGDRFACALFEDQSIKCFGDKMPTNMTPPNHFFGMKALISGSNYACAYGDTDLQCWGSTEDARLVVPKIVGEIKQAVAGDNHACLQDAEMVKCWGRNTEGQYQFFPSKN